MPPGKAQRAARRALVRTALALCLSPLMTRADDFDRKFEEKLWSEVEAALPAFPQEANLRSFEIAFDAEKRYFIDEKAVSVGEDGVVRYTLLVVGAGGAKNISHEGMRCATAERRFYAFGRPDGTWSKARGNAWKHIGGQGRSHHVELFTHYLCSGGFPNRLEDIFRFLAQGAPSSVGVGH